MRERILVTPRSLKMEPHAHVERLRELGWEIVHSTRAFNTVEPETIDIAAVAATSLWILRSESGAQVRKRNGTSEVDKGAAQTRQFDREKRGRA